MMHLRAFTVALLLLALGGCSFFEGLFGGGKPASKPPDPFVGGVLNAITERAPGKSPTQMLAELAMQFGWEDQVANNPVLKKDVLAGKFADGVEPFLLGLYYRNGFTVLPIVGEGHEFNRDTVVQGAVGSARLLDTSRKAIRIIFLRPVQNVQIIYYQDGVEPQVFSVSDRSVLSVRQSLVKYYLR